MKIQSCTKRLIYLTKLLSAIIVFNVSVSIFAKTTTGGRTPPPTCQNLGYPTKSSICVSKPSLSCTYGNCSSCNLKRGYCEDNYEPMPASLGFNLNPSSVSTSDSKMFDYKTSGKSKPKKGSSGAYDVKAIQRFGLDSNGKTHVIAKYSDLDSETCLDLTVNGGETICDIGEMSGIHRDNLQDDVLIFISTFNRPIFAKCTYFDPTCDDCCVSWTPKCCPPPPPPI